MAVRFGFLKKRNIFERWDILPFLILYPLLFYPCITFIRQSWIDGEVDDPSNSTFAFIIDHVDVATLEPHTFNVIIPFFLVMIHVLILLAPGWSVKIDKFIRYKESNSEKASHVVFYPSPHHGSPAIVKYERESTPPYAVFQQKRREYFDDSFHSPKYPTDLAIEHYTTHQGLQSKDIDALTKKYGLNAFTMPIPTIKQLLIQQVTSPLFVFNIFTQLIYIFDEFITTPLTSIAMSLFMSYNTIKTRRQNMLELRGADMPHVDLFVKRDRKWIEMSSDELLPGDLVLISEEFTTPCDLLVIKGRAVVNEAMLTGESTPQVKDPATLLDNDDVLNVKRHRNHILFGGTKIEQLIPNEESDGLPKPGVVCYVLSTGLGSSQGRLIRTIFLASGKVQTDTQDALKLIGFLSIFALSAGLYVWYNGVKSKSITSFRLVVEILMIFSSTIPPDLTTELSITINSSLLALTKLKVFCTEPHRIPYAGTIDICCFDKTGTLTAEEYEMIGVDDLQQHPIPKLAEIKGSYIYEESQMPDECLWVIGGCHSLVRDKNGALIGDSVEATAFNTMKFNLWKDKISRHRIGEIVGLKEFRFSSELRRMTVICRVPGQSGYMAVTKGAPEVVAEHLREVPENYFETYRGYTRQGCRVLAMAIRPVDSLGMNRDEVERDLTFVGFLVFSAAIKRGSEDTVVALLKSNHRIIIITGDDPLTACHVAKVLRITNQPPAIHDKDIRDENGEALDDTTNYASCYTGYAFERLAKEEKEKVLRECCVFARMSPQQKSSIVIGLKELGYKVLMCGDGTNDVNAIKQADVGMGLLERSIDVETVEGTAAAPGAASIAAPFVSKRPTISSVIDVVRYGRATLSSVIDTFKTISMNCIIAAFSKSVLYIENVRFGDRQITIFNILLMFASVSNSLAKPLRQLEKERPFENQFNGYLVTSVLLQAAVHFVILYLCRQAVIDEGFGFDPFNYRARFQPNLMNTAMYILTGEMDIVTSIVNYRGPPFMESIWSHSGIIFGIASSSMVILVLLLDLNPSISKIFQIVRFPSKAFQFKLFLFCVLDAILTFVAEHVSLNIFTKRNREISKGLVDEELQESLADYISNDNDVLPEELYEFGFAEMLKQSMEQQQQARIKDSKQMMQEASRIRAEEAKAKKQASNNRK